MSNMEDTGEEGKARSRTDRRTSVQFIDINLIRRRSSGNDKPAQSQSQRLGSINSKCETDFDDLDHLQQYSEKLVSFVTHGKRYTYIYLLLFPHG